MATTTEWYLARMITSHTHRTCRWKWPTDSAAWLNRMRQLLIRMLKRPATVSAMPHGKNHTKRLNPSLRNRSLRADGKTQSNHFHPHLQRREIYRRYLKPDRRPASGFRA